MTQADASEVPFIGSVFHPSDFSPASERAFAHALAIALLRQADFAVLHGGRSDEQDWEGFPGVRQTLERWGLLESGSPRSAVFERLRVRVAKIMAHGQPLRACLQYVREARPDLIVLATEGREGVARWLRPSLAETLAERSDAMTLFVPAEGRGIVAVEDGHLTLHRILIPVDERPDPRETLIRAERAATLMGDGPVEVNLLHVNGAGFAFPEPPNEGACTWREVHREGKVLDAILEEGEGVDLIAMTTEGRQGFLDALRGSVTQQVVRRAMCPVLAVPAR